MLASDGRHCVLSSLALVITARVTNLYDEHKQDDERNPV